MDYNDLEVQPITHNKALDVRKPPDIDEGEEVALLVQVKASTLSWGKQAMIKHREQSEHILTQAKRHAKEVAELEAEKQRAKEEAARLAAEADRLREEQRQLREQVRPGMRRGTPGAGWDRGGAESDSTRLDAHPLMWWLPPDGADLSAGDVAHNGAVVPNGARLPPPLACAACWCLALPVSGSCSGVGACGSSLTSTQS